MVSMANGSDKPTRNRQADKAGHTTSPGWHPEDIKAAIRKRGTTLSDLSRAHGYNDQAARLALRNRRSYAVEAVIATELGVPAHEIWPDRYDSNGKPLDARRQQRVERLAASNGRASIRPSKAPKATRRRRST